MGDNNNNVNTNAAATGADNSAANAAANNAGNANNQQTNTQQNTQQNDNSNTQQKNTGTSSADIDKAKADAVSALLAELGYEDVDALKTVTKKAKADEDAKKSDLEKKDEALTAMTKQLATEHEARIVAEAKNAAIKLGAKPELVDDLVIIAKAKVTKDKDINAIIAEMKDSTSGDVYFVKDNNDGQGNNNNGRKTFTRGQVHKNVQQNNNAGGNDDNNGNNNHAGTMAARLLAKKTAKKSYYFK